MIRFAHDWAIGAIVAALGMACLIGALVFATAQTAGERRETYYPGQCPDDSGWYLVESDQTHVVIGCYDPDYTPPTDPSE